MPRAENIAKRTPTSRDVFNRFGAYLLDEERCRELVISKLHPALACPDCATKLTWTQDAAFRQNKRVMRTYIQVTFDKEFPRQLNWYKNH